MATMRRCSILAAVLLIGAVGACGPSSLIDEGDNQDVMPDAPPIGGDVDTDGDTISDYHEGTGDRDGDGDDNLDDLDADNDGLTDAAEAGILHKMQAEAPGKTLIAAPPDDETCACNVCPHMRRNTLEKLYLCLRDLAPQVDVPEPVRVRALAPIERMLAMSV